MTKYFLLLLMMPAFLASAQNGPVLPQCPMCEETHLMSQPHEGMWWNPHLSGVGMGIEIQNNKVLGTYYGYNDAGLATWYTFVGNLKSSNDPKVMWQVDATLSVFENGVCFNCEFQTPSMSDFSASIHLTFNQPNHASYRINDGEEQNIVPFLYAQNASADFMAQTDFEVPELSGTWVFAEAILPVNEFHPITSSALFLSDKHVKSFADGTKELSISGTVTDVVIPVLNCKTYLDDNGTIAGPTCVLFGTVNADGSSDNGYYVNLAGIGINKIIGKKTNGDSIEAFKMEFGQDN